MKPRVRSAQELPATALAAVLGLAWGMFWIPMREIDAAGVRGPWATVAVYVALCAVVLPLWWLRRQPLAREDRLLVVVGGIAAGLSLSLYATSFLYTEVIRAILLYYMTPVWSALLERLLFRTPLGPVRLVALASGLGGLCLVLGVDQGFPVPRNAGDWMALVGGVAWSVATVALYKARSPQPETYAACSATSALAFNLAVALLAGVAPPADGAAVLSALPMVLLLAWGLMLGSSLAVPWMTRHAGPTRTGLMYMLETPIAGFTAAWLTQEVVGAGEVAGALLIMAAGVLDTVWGHVRVAAPGEVELAEGSRQDAGRG